MSQHVRCRCRSPHRIDCRCRRTPSSAPAGSGEHGGEGRWGAGGPEPRRCGRAGEAVNRVRDCTGSQLHAVLTLVSSLFVRSTGRPSEMASLV